MSPDPSPGRRVRETQGPGACGSGSLPYVSGSVSVDRGVAVHVGRVMRGRRISKGCAFLKKRPLLGGRPFIGLHKRQRQPGR